MSNKNSQNNSINNSVRLDCSNHNLNNSCSKQKFSFPKAIRFDCSQSNDGLFYNVPSTRNHRATSFGYGNKDMGMSSNLNRYAPQPATYNLTSQFDTKRKRGISFGPGREEMQMGSPLRQSYDHRYIPGPGNYRNNTTTLDNHNITLKSRQPDRSLMYLKRIPGPGAYNAEEFGAPNYYISSKHTNKTNYGKISSSSGHKQLVPPQKIAVSPASYRQDISSIKPDGRYALSRNQSSKSRYFSKSPRQSLVYKHLLQTPGPYNPFSEFGPV